MNKDLTDKEVKDFLRTHKKRAGIVLSVLQKKKQFYDAISSEVGSQIMGGVIQRMEYLLEKIINGDFTDEERIELKVLRKLSGEWADHVAAYRAETEKVRLNKI